MFLGSVNCFNTILATLLVGLIAKCGGGPAPVAQPKPAQNPCEQQSIGYAPIGKIAKMDEVPVAQKRSYGSHVLVDASGNIQWVLQSPNLQLDPFASDGHWYRVEGSRSAEHPDLFVVCAVSPEA